MFDPGIVSEEKLTPVRKCGGYLEGDRGPKFPNRHSENEFGTLPAELSRAAP